MKNGLLRILNDLIVMDEEERGTRTKEEGQGGNRDEEEGAARMKEQRGE